MCILLVKTPMSKIKRTNERTHAQETAPSDEHARFAHARKNINFKYISHQKVHFVANNL